MVSAVRALLTGTVLLVIQGSIFGLDSDGWH